MRQALRKHYSQQRLSIPRWNVIIICSALLIAFVTLFPFNFVWQEGISSGNIFPYFHHPSNIADFIGNIVLFIPLSFSISGWLRRRRINQVAIIITVVYLSFSFSIAIEILQVFLPSRSPTYSDVLANTLGGLGGWLIFEVCATILGHYTTTTNPVYRSLSVQKIFGLLVAYIAVTLLLSIPNPNASSLSNWETNFPLVIGNEATGNRPWEGKISQLWISDRALTKGEVQQAFSDPQFSPEELRKALVAGYHFLGGQNYRDRTGNLPNLVWKGNSLKVDKPNFASLNSHQWLETPKPVTILSQQIRQTSQFSIGVTLATAQLHQTGPARIISVSDSPYQRNLTVGQESDNLIFRLRTPKTGENGKNPVVILLNLLNNKDWHQLIITYDGFHFTCYIDDVQNFKSINLNFPIPLFGRLSFLWNQHKLYLYPTLLNINNILAYSIFFIPISILILLLYLNFKLDK